MINSGYGYGDTNFYVVKVDGVEGDFVAKGEAFDGSFRINGAVALPSKSNYNADKNAVDSTYAVSMTVRVADTLVQDFLAQSPVKASTHNFTIYAIDAASGVEVASFAIQNAIFTSVYQATNSPKYQAKDANGSAITVSDVSLTISSQDTATSSTGTERSEYSFVNQTLVASN